MFIAPGVQGIDQDEINISIDPPVLKGIVEDQVCRRFGTAVLKQVASCRDPIGVQPMRDSREQLIENELLIVGSILTGVPPADDGWAVSRSLKRADDPSDRGSLPSAASSQVSHANHTGRDTMAARQPPVKQPVSN